MISILHKQTQGDSEMEELDRDEVYDSIIEGVRQAFPEITHEFLSSAIEDGVSQMLPDMGDGRLQRAITNGIENAMWRMMTNATQMPCADFYEAVTNGIAKGIEEAASRGYLGK